MFRNVDQFRFTLINESHGAHFFVRFLRFLRNFQEDFENFNVCARGRSAARPTRTAGSQPRIMCLLMREKFLKFPDSGFSFFCMLPAAIICQQSSRGWNSLFASQILKFRIVAIFMFHWHVSSLYVT